jgi:hypothetical protein
MWHVWERSSCRGLVGKSEEKPSGISRHRWENNNKPDL